MLPIVQQDPVMWFSAPGIQFLVEGGVIILSAILKGSYQAPKG